MTSSAQFNREIVVRFAPSPNGLLHLGHAYAAILAHDYARERGARFLLRIEDIDTARSKPEFVDAIFADLLWLGLDWDGEVIFQSDRFDDYAVAVERLKRRGLLYPCFCSRSEIRVAQEKHGKKQGADGPIYPGTCRNIDASGAAARMKMEAHSWRLDVDKAHAITGQLQWHDEQLGLQLADPSSLGDVVLVPKDTPVSYHLAVTVDDARDAVTDVVRGMDLFASTHIHRLLQGLLDLPTPKYVHHGLLLDETGSKLAKSRASSSLSQLRKAGENGKRLAEKLRNSILPVGNSLLEG
ncbi:Glutamyl-Q tRNA(Asp) synthetase [hydrothermal vent metagenome]|uniref:Glutamyl-Q tRNA(Asp) synthetase n=1 Tax=hydrothermal vent metagenome TaxID=652676 RepID=A0A3B0RML2_9ZZZZ